MWVFTSCLINDKDLTSISVSQTTALWWWPNTLDNFDRGSYICRVVELTVQSSSSFESPSACENWLAGEFKAVNGSESSSSERLIDGGACDECRKDTCTDSGSGIRSNSSKTFTGATGGSFEIGSSFGVSDASSEFNLFWVSRGLLLREFVVGRSVNAKCEVKQIAKRGSGLAGFSWTHTPTSWS